MATEKVEYVVRIVGLVDHSNDNKTTDNSNTNSDTKEASNSLIGGIKNLNKILHPMQNAMSSAKASGNAAAYYGIQLANQTINNVENIVRTSINRYYQLSEDYKSQNYLSNSRAALGSMKSFGGSIVSGAIAGSTMGPIGMVLGAALGATNVITGQVINYQNKMIEYKSAINTTNINTAFRAERAGLYDGGRGTEN